MTAVTPAATATVRSSGSARTLAAAITTPIATTRMSGHSGPKAWARPGAKRDPHREMCRISENTVCCVALARGELAPGRCRGPRLWRRPRGLPVCSAARRYHQPPVTPSPATSSTPARIRSLRSAARTVPTTSTTPGTRNVYLVPAASPRAMPAARSSSHPPSGVRMRATAAISDARPTTSLNASPGWVVLRTGRASSSAPPARVSGSTRQRRPAHHAASSASAIQPRLSSGERKSLPSATMPMA